MAEKCSHRCSFAACCSVSCMLASIATQELLRRRPSGTAEARYQWY
jgi:hypothetical protein